MNLSAFEREVVIIYNDAGNFATIYSAHRPTITKLDKLCNDCPESYKLVKEDECSKTYHCTKNLISFRKPSTKREMSEEQKEKARERMKQIQAKKKLNK